MRHTGLKTALLLVAFVTQSHAGSIPEESKPRPVKAVYEITAGSEISYAVDVKILMAINSTANGKASGVTGGFTINPVASADVASKQNPVSGELFVDVTSFRSGVGKRDSNVRRLLESDKYPQIKFAIMDIEPQATAQSGTFSGGFTVKGSLDIRGKAREISFPVVVSPKGGKLLIDGNFQLKLTDFGIDPPTVAVFVGRAKDEISLNVHLVAEAKKPGLFAYGF
jgi:polyisoprenoid-binding protein YceI